VSLARLHEWGFGVPADRFIRALSHHYMLELHNFYTNSISQAAVFVAVCEGYLGVEAHWDLWRHLFRGEHYTEHAQQGPRRAACVGGLMLQVRENRRTLYIPCKMTTNNRDWSRGWFYLRNDGERLPAFTGKVLTEKPGQARGVHRHAASSGRQGVDGGRHHREFSPAEGDSPHGEEVGNLRADLRGRS